MMFKELSESSSKGNSKKKALNWLIPAVLIGVFLAVSIITKHRFTLPLLLVLVLPAILIIPFKGLLVALVWCSFAMQSDHPWWSVHLGSLRVAIPEIILILSFVLLFMELLTKREKLKLPPIASCFIPICVYFFFSLILGLLNKHPTSFINLDIHRTFAYFAIFPLVYLFQSKKDIRLFYITVVSAALFIAIYTLSPILLSPLSPLKSVRRGRILIRNVVLFPFALAFLSQLYIQSKKKKDKILAGVFLLSGFLAMLFTQNRTSWVGSVIALSLFFALNYFWLMPKEKRGKFLAHTLAFLGSGIVGLGVIVLLFFRDTFLSFWQLRLLSFKFLKYDPAILARRLGIYESKILFKDSPLIGHGFGATWHSMGYPMTSTDNFYCIALVKLGLLGTILLFLPYIFWGRELVYILRRLKKIENPVHLSLMVGILVFYPTLFIMQLVTAHLFDPAIVVATISLMVLTDYTYRQLKSSEKL